MITAKEIVNQIDEALKMFGECNYYDKGAREVMDVDSIAAELMKLSADEIITILKEVDAMHEQAYPCIRDVLGCMDCWQGQEADKLFDDEFIQENY